MSDTQSSSGSSLSGLRPQSRAATPHPDAGVAGGVPATPADAVTLRVPQAVPRSPAHPPPAPASDPGAARRDVAGRPSGFPPGMVDHLRLAAVPGLSPRLVARLVRQFGSATAVFAATAEARARTPGVGAARSGLVAAAPSPEDVLRDLERARAAGAAVLVPGAPGWPCVLDDLSDPPSVLWARGDLARALAAGTGRPACPEVTEALGGRGVAIVGSRRASHYGLDQARRLASELAALGVPVVSGLARGVDGAAHRGALLSGGSTIGVLGGGLAQFYPQEHIPLAREIVAGGGAVVSEFPLDMPPLPHHFPRRNRLLAAMSAAVVVVEAAENSGSLLTADHALDLGREVLAIPGRIDQPNSRGVHRLLREGAAVCESAADVLAALGVEAVVEGGADGPGGDGARGGGAGPGGGVGGAADPAQRAILAALAGDELDADAVLTASGLPPDRGAAALAALEIRGSVRLSADGRYSIVRGRR